MKEILLAILLPQIILLPIMFLLRKIRKEEDEATPCASEGEHTESRVLNILREAFFSLKKQGGAGYGPWLSSAISYGCKDAGVALTAIQWTIRDLDGRRFKTDGLLMAKHELEEMMGEWG